MEKVVIKENWKHMFNQFIDANATDNDSEMGNDTNENIEEPITKTLLHGFTDSNSIYDLQNNQINIAPAKGCMPLGFFQDRYLEEVSFPTLFYGEKRSQKITKKIRIKNFLNRRFCTKTMTLHTTS
jgi:hypothetical protein